MGEYFNTSAVVRVGDGRGFVVASAAAGAKRYVFTAGHCLPYFPPCATQSLLHERTYKNIIGSLEGDRTICAECLYVDPIADIAVLGEPDGGELHDAWSAYLHFVDGVSPIRLAADNADLNISPVYLPTLGNDWVPATAKMRNGRRIYLEGVESGIVGGMSGSPILLADGSAIGVLGTSEGAPDTLHTNGGPQARLRRDLPVWLLTDLGLVPTV
jgi:hypothetical protein